MWLEASPQDPAGCRQQPSPLPGKGCPVPSALEDVAQGCGSVWQWGHGGRRAKLVSLEQCVASLGLHLCFQAFLSRTLCTRHGGGGGPCVRSHFSVDVWESLLSCMSWESCSRVALAVSAELPGLCLLVLADRCMLQMDDRCCHPLCRGHGDTASCCTYLQGGKAQPVLILPGDTEGMVFSLLLSSLMLLFPLQIFQVVVQEDLHREEICLH